MSLLLVLVLLLLLLGGSIGGSRNVVSSSCSVPADRREMAYRSMSLYRSGTGEVLPELSELSRDREG